MVEYGEQDPKVRDLTLRQKLLFLRRRLDEVPEYDSYQKYGGLWFRLLHPEVLEWTSTEPGISVLPPQEGKIKALITNRYLPHEGRSRPIGILLDFTRTGHITGVNFAVFGLGALGVTEEGKLVIDCRQLKTPTSYVQYALPNFFVDRQEIYQTEPEKSRVA